MRPRPFRLALASFAVLAALVWLPAATALLPEQHILAVPGSGVTTYATPIVVVEPGGALRFTNTDVMPHNVESHAPGPDDRPWCAGRAPGACPLFWTPLVSLGAETPVLGLDGLQAGTTYTFTCLLHPNMSGTLVVAEV